MPSLLLLLLLLWSFTHHDLYTHLLFLAPPQTLSFPLSWCCPLPVCNSPHLFTNAHTDHSPRPFYPSFPNLFSNFWHTNHPTTQKPNPPFQLIGTVQIFLGRCFSPVFWSDSLTATTILVIRLQKMGGRLLEASQLFTQTSSHTINIMADKTHIAK